MPEARVTTASVASIAKELVFAVRANTSHPWDAADQRERHHRPEHARPKKLANGLHLATALEPALPPRAGRSYEDRTARFNSNVSRKSNSPPRHKCQRPSASTLNCSTALGGIVRLPIIRNIAS